ncbi:uncharacterized protein LOC6644609 [Drosophila willistoni]|uniref:uncharacterized protein LOC6644609 n=1 Tax=Drosophila willistoni TaxID=7260 RepID=UPI000C26C2B0|nr:uncharacterized protein LOC6644609 [Drosophila willistoni]
MPNSKRRPKSHEDPNEQLIFQYLPKELFDDEEEPPMGDRPEERPPKYPVTDLVPVSPALEPRPNLEVLKSFFEKHHQQENQMDKLNTEQKKVNNFDCRISLLKEIPPLLPPRRKSCSQQCPGYQQIFANSGLCKPPKLDGQGYDKPFPYPELISESREERAVYVFSVVDKLVLQLEHCIKQTKNNRSLVHIENSVKSATGAVPKTNPRRLQSSVESSADVKRSSKQHKLGQLPLHQHHLSKHQRREQRQQQILEAEFDLDCEFGMEYIQKFRDNTVRSTKLPHAALSDKDEGISSDSSGSPKLYIDSPIRKPPMRLQTVEERPCTPSPVVPKPLSLKSNVKPTKHYQSMHQPVKSYKLEYRQPILTDEIESEEKSKQPTKQKQQQQQQQQQHHVPIPLYMLQGRPKLTPEKQLKQKEDKPNIQKEQPKLEQDEETSKQEKKVKKPKEELEPLEFHDSRREYQLRRIQERQAIFLEIHNQGLKLERLHKDDKKRRKQYKLQLKLEQRQQHKLNPLESSEVLNYYKIGLDPLGRTLITPSMPGQSEREMGEDNTKTHFPLSIAKTSLKSLTTSKEHQMSLVKFDDQNKQKSGFQLRDSSKTSFVNWWELSKYSGPVSKMKSARRRVHPYVPCPVPKQVIPIPEPVVILEEEEEEKKPSPRKVDSKEEAEEEEDEEDEDYEDYEEDTMSRITKVFVDPTKLPKLPDLTKASEKPNAAAVIYLLHQEDSQQQKVGWKTLSNLRKKVAKYRKRVFTSSDETSDATLVNGMETPRRREKGHRKEQFRFNVMTQIKLLPPSGDFRSYFEIDGMSIMILERMTQLSYKKGFQPSPLVTDYLKHFYRQRCLKDTTNFHWYVNEGFFPTHLLLEEHNPLGVHLGKRSYKDIDAIILIYLKQKNVDGKCPPLKLTEIMAYYMVNSYCRVLLENATDTKRPIEERFLLRTRFAVSNIESFMLDLNLNVLVDDVNCHKLLQWALLQENRVCEIYGEALKSAEERADLAKQKTQFVMRTPNLEAFYDFYNENQYPRPDALAINPLMNKVRRYQLSYTECVKPYSCPIAGCGINICSKTLLAHFLSDHCRRLEELWLKDRMVYVFHPQSYPPDQIHCICCTALLPCKPTKSVPYPRRVLNYELAPHHLYFAEHTPCLLMYTQISVDRLLGPSESETESESAKLFRPQRTLYVFWLGSSGDSKREFACDLNIYGCDKTVPSYSPMKSIKMSKMLNVPHMMTKYEGRYLAIDHNSMSAMTHNFRELIYIDVHYVDLHSPKED